jgi:hypothetical protein
MRIRFSIAIYDGRAVVLEQRPELPLIVHTFDAPEDALAFYERCSDEPLDPQRLANIAARLKLASTAAPEAT